MQNIKKAMNNHLVRKRHSFIPQDALSFKSKKSAVNLSFPKARHSSKLSSKVSSKISDERKITQPKPNLGTVKEINLIESQLSSGSKSVSDSSQEIKRSASQRVSVDQEAYAINSDLKPTLQKSQKDLH